MIFFSTVTMALEAIRRNKLRSFLTALGIVIGVGSVIAMVHVGQSATRSVTDQIASMGPNLLTVLPGTARRGPGAPGSSAKAFTAEDAKAIEEEVFDILSAPSVSSRVTVVYGNTNYTTSVTGSTNEFLDVRDWSLASGRTFESNELVSGAAVCILGQTIVKEVYQDEDPIGTSLRVGQTSCQIVGVLEKKGSTMGQDQDDLILMPLKAVQRRLLGSDDIQSIYVSALGDNGSAQAQQEIEELLRQRRGIEPGDVDDFHVRSMEELSNTLTSSTAILTALLGAIAAVSLLVGGIGIMNIMLVSVTERTREIGTRLAIGAMAHEVLLQFLVEAIVLSVLGGVLGIGLGLFGSWLITKKLSLPFVLSPSIITVAFVFSGFIGILFGYVPARKAARLHPIEALRHE